MAEKSFQVTRYEHTNNDVITKNYGILPESDVKRMLKGYTFDEMFGLWYSKKGNVGYDLTEV